MTIDKRQAILFRPPADRHGAPQTSGNQQARRHLREEDPDRLDEVLALLYGFMSNDQARLPARKILDKSPDSFRDILKILGIPDRNGELAEYVKWGLEVVVSGYMRGRLYEENRVNVRSVRDYLKHVKKRPSHQLSVLGKTNRYEVPTAITHSKQLLLEAAVLLSAGYFNYRRGSMSDPTSSHDQAELFGRVLYLHRGIAAVSNRRTEPFALGRLIRDVMGQRHPTKAQNIEVLANFIDSRLFTGDMDGLLARAAAFTLRALPEHGAFKLGPPARLTLAWGCLELLVAFAPSAKPSTPSTGPLQKLVRNVHQIAYPDDKADGPDAIASDQVRMIVPLWNDGRPALLFCDDVTAKTETDRAAAKLDKTTAELDKIAAEEDERENVCSYFTGTVKEKFVRYVGPKDPDYTSIAAPVDDSPKRPKGMSEDEFEAALLEEAEYDELRRRWLAIDYFCDEGEDE